MTNPTQPEDQDLPDGVIREFLRVLEDARRQEMSCRQVFARLDEYVENELRDHEAARLMPLLREHLDICADCCQEYEALLGALGQGRERNQDPNRGSPR